MPRAALPTGVELDYATTGDPADPALLLIIGMAIQRTGWDEEFLAQLAAQGFHLITFDNRDVGLSTAPESQYSLADMAQDAVGLLDHLGVAAAHVAGQSMGGLIAQLMAIHHPDRVLSLCSISATTGNPEVGQGDPAATAVFLRPRPSSREEIIEHGTACGLALASVRLGVTEADMRARVIAAYERAYRPEGGDRHGMAVLSAPDRTAALARLSLPTVVIHGEADPLIGVSGGRATAAAIPGAELVVIPDMAHDLPRPVWPVVIAAITKNTRR